MKRISQINEQRDRKDEAREKSWKIINLYLIFSFFFQMVSFKEASALGSGGFSNQVVGLRTLGKGNSAAAYPDDATTVYMNPAGMVFLEEGPQVESGITFEILQFEHKSPSGVKTQGEKSIIKVPHFFYTTGNAINDRLSVGFGLSAPFGLQTEWDDQSFARFIATETELAVIDHNAVAAYKVRDDFSIAAGFSYYDTYASLKKVLNVAAINTSLMVPSAGTGTQQIKAEDIAWGYNFALYYEPGENHRFGAAYRSRVFIDYKGRLRWTGLSGASSAQFGGGGSTYETRTTSSLTLPESVELGYSYTPPSKKWTWELDFAWMGWDSQDHTRYDFPEESNATNLAILGGENPLARDWKDSISVGTGLEYRLLDWLDLRTGFYFYETPVPGDNLEPSLPDANRYSITAGLGFRKSGFRADTAYVVIISGNRSIDNSVGSSSGSSIDGEFNALSHLFGLNVSWVF